MLELEEYAEAKLGISARDMDLVAMSMMRTRPVEPGWVILDGPRYDFWKILDRVAKKLTGIGVVWMTDLRVKRPRWANADVDEVMMERARERVLHDHQAPVSYRQAIHPRSRYMDLEGECLRAKVELNWTKQPDKREEEEFAVRLGRVLSPELRRESPVPISRPNETLINAVKMAVIGNPSLNPASALRNARIIPPTHAVMNGRDRLTEADHWVLYRILRDSMRPWTLKILTALSEGEGYQTVEEVVAYTGLEREVVVGECARMSDMENTMAAVEWPKLKRGSGKGGRRAKYLKLNEDWGVGQDMRSFIKAEMRWWGDTEDR